VMGEYCKLWAQSVGRLL